ncbi:type II toxin-antitoxin system VapC family toxin [Candidatus Pacearchaeota archaeon]|nr:type II toxin-antitoxin system VapC family toxin [Candidatus Pacearchaeota archaeon]
MKYLDANVFIYPVIDNDKRADFYKKIIYEVVSKKIQACTSILTWDEVIHYLIKEKGKSFALMQSEKFLKLPNLYFIEASSSIIFKAHQLMKIYEINPRDAIHLATALSCKSDEIISEDKVFDKIKEIKRVGFR